MSGMRRTTEEHRFGCDWGTRSISGETKKSSWSCGRSGWKREVEKWFGWERVGDSRSVADAAWGSWRSWWELTRWWEGEDGACGVYGVGWSNG